MIDIIIPTYNARNTIRKTLDSIKIQDYKDFKVTIVRDTGDLYDDIVDDYKDFFKVSILNLEVNGGPGVARQYGIDNTYGEYIVFIDSDDYLYNEHSLGLLLNNIGTADLCVGEFIYERDNEVLVKKENFIWLHGKIYRRRFLIDNNIRFNNTRANEDNGFNRLLLFHRPKIKILNEIVYVYAENENSITRKNNRFYKYSGLEWYAYNMYYAMRIAIEKNLNIQDVFNASLGVLVAMYFYYLELQDDYDVNALLNWSSNIKNVYKTYYDKYGSSRLVQSFLEQKKSEYFSKKIKYTISFDEFLEKI
ncbi:MAG: glycosyltransferase family 2 protein [Bacilli bacterium]|nr:glycosyltransferase family 2 protein [Bacilli bacterium]